MPEQRSTNKLSIYLVKDSYDTPDKVLADFSRLKSQLIDPSATLYYKKSGGYEPGWLSKFFGSSLADSLKENLLVTPQYHGRQAVDEVRSLSSLVE